MDKALDLANAAIKLDDRNPKALAFKAAVLLKLKDSIGAKREAQAAADIDPANADALIVLASERMVAGDNEGALSILDLRLQLKTEDEFAIQLVKLQIFEKMGDLEQQEALLRKFIDRYPLQSAPRNSLINLYVKQKRNDDAEKEIRALAAANPSDLAAGLNVVPSCSNSRGQPRRGKTHARINAGGQQLVKYQLALAQFDLAQGKVADSIQLLESLVSSARSSEDLLAAQVKLAQIQFRQKKFDVAETLVSSILRKDNRNIDGLKLQASLRLQQGQRDAAIADLRQALDDQPRWPSHDPIGKCL